MGGSGSTTTVSTSSGGAAAPEPSTPPVQLAPGEWVGGRYRVDRLIGRGGYGEVYRVLDAQADDRAVALKLHRARRVSRMALAALRSEFGLLSTLSHPNLAAVHDFAWVPGEYAYFTETLVEGTPLSRAGVDPATPEGAGLLVQLCRALDYLHARGLIHGDVKPSNVMVDAARAHVTLVDFGVARALGPEADALLVGSPPYLAPELVTGAGGDARADLYALGISLYQLVLGRPPFIGPKEDVLRMQVEAEPPDLPHGVPLPLRVLIARLLAKDPDDRPPSAAAVLADLARIGGLEASVDTDETLASHLLSAPVVGRLTELFELTARAEGAATPGRPVLLSGLAGAGKSRLVRELRRRAQLRGQTWLSAEAGRAREDLLQRVAAAVLDRPRRERLSEEARIELARALPELRRPRERIAVPIDPARALERRLEALAAVLVDRFHDAPGVLAVEDLHWASRAEIESLVSLVSHARQLGASCFVLLTARSEVASPLARAFGAEVMECPPLRVRAARRLIEATFGDAAVLDGTAFGARIAAAPSGALWLQESLRDAIERGALVRRGARFERAHDVEARELAEVLASRVARRTPAARRVALGLAILDEPASAHALVRVSGLGRRRALDALSELVRAGILERRAEGAHPRYVMQERYAHAMTERASPRSLRAARRRVGRWLAGRGGADFRGLAQAARVLEAAGERDAAVAALGRAADLAQEGGRPEHAVRLLEEERRLRPREDPARPERLLRLYDLALRAGFAESAGLALMELADAAVDGGDPRFGLAVAIRGARQALRDGDLHDARAGAERVLARATEIGLDALAAEAAVLAAEVEHTRGAIEEALARYGEALARARALDRADLEATAGLAAAILHLRRGARDAATALAEEAVRAAERAGDPILRSEAHRVLGNVRLASARRQPAIASYRAAVRVARSAGDAVSEAKALNNLASAALSLGRAMEALEAWNRAIVLKEGAGAIPSAMVTWASMTGALLLFGRREAARYGQQRVIDSPRADHPVAVAVAWSNRGDLELVEGNLDAAVEAYDRGADGYRALAMAHLSSHPLSGLVRARLARGADGDLRAAERELGELEALARASGGAAERRRALTARALWLDATGAPLDGLPAARAAARIVEADGGFEDALASVVEAAWIVALLSRRGGRATARAVARAQRRLEARAAKLDGPLRDAFRTQHPLHGQILRGDLATRPGTTWSPPSGAAS